MPLQALVWSFRVVVQEVLHQFILELGQVLERRAFDQVVIERAPEAFDLAVGLGSVGPGVAVFEAELQQHALEGVLRRLRPCRHLRTVVGEDGLELDAVLDVEQVEALEGSEHDTQALEVRHHLSPGQTSAGVQHGDQVVALGAVHQQVAAEVMAVQMPQFARAGLDDGALGLFHGRFQAVEPMASADSIDG